MGKGYEKAIHRNINTNVKGNITIRSSSLIFNDVKINLGDNIFQFYNGQKLRSLIIPRLWSLPFDT